MKVLKIKITNFRGINTEREIELRHFTTLVGRNDSGKSTVLKALDLFLNESTFERDYINQKSQDPLTSIELFLDPENIPIIIDENIPTTFEDDELLNKDGQLQIKKTWDGSKTSRITPTSYIIRKRYANHDCVLLNEQDLINICNALSIATRKANNEEYNNVEKRKKIRNYLSSHKVEFDYIEEKIPTSGSSRLRNIGTTLKDALPKFQYFRADTSLSESDTAIQNFFKNLAEEAIAQEINHNEVEKIVTGKLQSVLTKITEKINKVVPEEEKIEPQIKFDWSKLVQTVFRSKNIEGEIPFHARGDGFRRITMMSYFEYLAEQQKSEKQNMYFGFEEPETFLHPSAQENLFQKLKELCGNDYQVIISTHSPIIVAKTDMKDIIHIVKENGQFSILPTNLKSIAQDLGITVDNQFISLFENAKLLFLVEGIDDANAFNHVSALYKQNGEIDATLKDLGAVSIPAGGCGSVKHWVTLNLLNTLNKPCFIFQDADISSPTETSKNKVLLEELGFVEGRDFLVSQKRELENYIPCDALNRLVPEAKLNYGDYDDVKKICKVNAFAGKLGGGNVLEKYFESLNYADVKKAFFDGNEDEFLKIYTLIKAKL